MGLRLLWVLFIWLLPPKTGISDLSTGVAFTLFPLIAWYCLQQLRQGRLQWAIQIFIAIATILVVLVTIFMPDNLVLNPGMMGAFLLVRLATFLRTSRAIYVLGSLWALIYLISIAARDLITLPQIDLGLFNRVFEYLLPVAILIVFILLDPDCYQYFTGSSHHQRGRWFDLSRSYTLLIEQKQSLEKSEADLRH